MIRRRAREIIELDVLPFGDVRSPADDACRRHVPAWRGGRDAVGAGDPRSQCSPIGGGEARYARAVRRWSSGVGASQCPVLGALHGRCRSRGGEDVIHDAADDGAVERAPFVRALFAGRRAERGRSSAVFADGGTRRCAAQAKAHAVGVCDETR